jgi:hypothetical protein
MRMVRENLQTCEKLRRRRASDEVRWRGISAP